jgi:hypothetical protein
MKVLTFILLVFFSLQTLQANTMYMLTKFPSLYLVVENYSQKVSNETKEEIMEELQSVTEELGIDTSGFSHRSLAVILYETPVADMVTLNIELAIGEMVKRIDSKDEVFALSYQQKRQITYNNKSDDEINEIVLDSIMMLVNSFADQYKDDNMMLTSASNGDYQQFAKDLKYETQYKEALKKAKEQKKDIMFVMVANFCPWCVKLEKQILAKNKYNDMIQKNYIPLIINREEGGFPKQFETPIVPTIYFVSHEDETIKKKIVGYKNRFDFLNYIAR